MPIIDPFKLPESPQELKILNEPLTNFLILFIASNDPETNLPWCSDVRAALPVTNRIFSGPTAPTVRHARVGLKAE